MIQRGAPPSAPDEDLATGRSPSVPVTSAADPAIAKLPQQEHDNADNEQNPTSPDTYRCLLYTSPTTISAPIVGMAYGAYDAHVEHQGKRVRAAFAGEKAKDDPFAKVRIAEAASDIDAAWRQLIGNVGDEYALLAAGKEIPFELRARARRDQVRATGRSIASIDRLFEASGATALANDAPVQRFWRDAHAGRVHAANDPERAYVIFGNNEFGLPPGDTMV